MFSFLLGIYRYLGGLLSHRNPMFNLQKLPGCLPKQQYHFSFNPAMKECFCCSTSLTAFGVIYVLDFGHFNSQIVRALLCFNLNLSDDLRCGASFHILGCHLHIFFHQVSLKVFGPLLNQIVCCLTVEFLQVFCKF